MRHQPNKAPGGRWQVVGEDWRENRARLLANTQRNPASSFPSHTLRQLDPERFSQLQLDQPSQSILSSYSPIVTVRQSPLGGFGVFALQSFEPGQHIFASPPDVACSTATHLCAHCAMPLSAGPDKPVQNAVPCSHCEVEQYCSTECRDKAWQDYHRALCGVDYRELAANVRKAGFSSSSKLPLFALRLSGWLLSQSQTALDSARQAHPSRSLPSPVPMLSLHEFPNFFLQRMLERTHESLRARFRKFGMSAIDGLHFHYKLQQLLEQRNAASRTAVTVDMRHIDWHFYETARALFTLYSFATPTLMEEMFGALPHGSAVDFGAVSMFNHSCEPNCKVGCLQQTNVLEVTALQPIAVGDELLISYIPATVDVDARQRQLAQYDFVCQCAKCVRERAAKKSASS